MEPPLAPHRRQGASAVGPKDLEMHCGRGNVLRQHATTVCPRAQQRGTIRGRKLRKGEGGGGGGEECMTLDTPRA